MPKSLNVQLACLFAFSAPSMATACTLYLTNLDIQPPTFTLSNSPLDSMAIGMPLSNWLETPYQKVLDSQKTCSYTLKTTRLNPNPSQKSIGNFQDENGVTHPIFPTSHPSVGFAVALMAQYAPFDIAHAKYSEWITANGTEITIPDLISSLESVHLKLRIRYIATGKRLASGPVVAPFPLATIKIKNSRQYDLEFTTHLNNTQLNLTTRSCQISQGSKSQNVALPPAVAHNFRAIGTESAQSQAFAITLKCDPDVAVHAGMSDANKPTNDTDILSTQGSAQGLGLRIYRDGTPSMPVRFGPDTPMAGDYPHRWVVGNSGASGSTLQLPFTVRYVQTGEVVTPGSVNAKATITFSYQ